MTRAFNIGLICTLLLLLGTGISGGGVSDVLPENIYNPGNLKPIDSTLKVKIGEPAPDFTLPSISGEDVTLSDYRGKKHVVLSFVPAAFTPVCSDQWPGYNIVKGLFEENEAILLGITVDNIPTLYAWTQQMGQLWFPVLSDFWPHGAVASRYGVLRSDGVSERALFVIDKAGVLRAIHVADIKVRTNLELRAVELKKLIP